MPYINAIPEIAQAANSVLYSLKEHPEHWCTGDSLEEIGSHISLPQPLYYMQDYVGDAFAALFAEKGCRDSDDLPDRVGEDETQWGLRLFLQTIRLMFESGYDDLPDIIPTKPSVIKMCEEINDIAKSMRESPDNWCTGMALEEIAKEMEDNPYTEPSFPNMFAQYYRTVYSITTQEQFANSKPLEPYEVVAMVFLSEVI